MPHCLKQHLHLVWPRLVILLLYASEFREGVPNALPRAALGALRPPTAVGGAVLALGEERPTATAAAAASRLHRGRGRRLGMTPANCEPELIVVVAREQFCQVCLHHLPALEQHGEVPTPQKSFGVRSVEQRLRHLRSPIHRGEPHCGEWHRHPVNVRRHRQCDQAIQGAMDLAILEVEHAGPLVGVRPQAPQRDVTALVGHHEQAAGGKEVQAGDDVLHAREAVLELQRLQVV
mmetsp:Transcript_95804/g.275048  ORF Transcript_95804/g.275048 Transcript_95804/m.275048 type:complete len:234 (-) Transcript_95804:481-1182(-)